MIVREAITPCYESLETLYNDSAECDSFPQVLDKLRALPATRELPDEELTLLEKVIAQHELGHVPDEYAQALKRVARTHRTGVVANISALPLVAQMGEVGATPHPREERRRKQDDGIGRMTERATELLHHIPRRFDGSSPHTPNSGR